MLKLVLMICVLALCLGAFICFAYEKQMIRRAMRTRARIVNFMPLSDDGQLVPMVEFTDENGRRICRSAQRMGAWGTKVGDEVDILYTHRTVLGMEAWNIFFAHKEGDSPFRIYQVAGWFLLALGVLLIALAFAIGLLS